MANIATNIFHATTANKQDLDKIEAFLDDNFDGYINRYADVIDAEFSSRKKKSTSWWIRWKLKTKSICAY